MNPRWDLEGWSDDRLCWACLGTVRYSIACMWWQCDSCPATWPDELLGEPA